MARSGVVRTLLVVFVAAPLAFLVVACSGPPEARLLTQFFRASQLRDNSTVAMMSAVEFDPRERGVVTDFEITSTTPEVSTPLNLEALVAAETQAREAGTAFTARKSAYQNANIENIERVLELEQTPDARIPAALAAVKAEWDKWRLDTTAHAKATADARAALRNATGPAEASLNQSGLPPFDPAQFDGDLISKTVTIDAEVRSPEGQTSRQAFIVSMQRVVGTFAGESREGRWVIMSIDET